MKLGNIHRFPCFSAGLLSLGLALGLLSGCGSNSDSKSKASAYQTTCALPNDQSGTLCGHWKAAPIPISFHGTDFNTAEINAVIAAADTWNDFFGASLQFTAIDYGDKTGRSSPSDKPSDLSGSIIDNTSGKYSGTVVIYKQKTWPYPEDRDSAISRTTFGSRVNGYFKIAYIELNYETFFSAGKRQPDLQTIILHEFGHLLGLGHSCDFQPGQGVPNCSDANINPSYVSASMYPTFGFDQSGAGALRQKLNENDQSRALCLYK